jgi:hypothetical protein
MPVQPLLPSQRNEVFETIQDRGHRPEDFEWEELLTYGGNMSGPLLRYRPVPTFYFLFAREVEGFVVRFAPGYESWESPTLGYGKWDDLVSPQLALWLDCIKRETQAPDLWGQLEQGRELLQAADATDDNTPFTPEEQTQVAAQLREIKEYLFATHSLSATQQVTIETRLAYLEQAATRMGRKDWSTILIGTLFSVVVETTLGADGASDLFRFAMNAVGHLLKGAVPHLPAGP